MNLNSVVHARSGNLTAEVQRETVILDAASGKYFGLNDVGARIWQLLQAPVAIETIVARLVQEYAVEYDAAASDVLRLMDELTGAGLVLVSSE